MYTRSLVIILLILAVSGCATAKKPASTQADEQRLQAQVSELQAQLKQKDQQIQDLKSRLVKAQKTYQSTTVDASKATPKQVQTALKNAGFYSGPIDGKIGKMSKEAIIEFQKANGLKADGVVGEKTWAKLGQYLN